MIYRRLTSRQVISSQVKGIVKLYGNTLLQVRDLTASRVLIWIVITFIISHSPKVILNIFDIYTNMTMSKKGLSKKLFPHLCI